MNQPNVDQESREYYKSIFDKYDQDENGAIELKELVEMLKSDDEVPRRIVKKLFHYSDKDNDGKINLDEFIDMVRDKKFKEIFGHYVDSYVNFVVPRSKQVKFRPAGRRAGTHASVETPYYTDTDGAYEESYSFCPPPIALVIMSLIEIACYVTDEVTEPDSTNRGNGVTAKLFIYDPYNRQQCWRFLTYMFVHIGYIHLSVNLLVQIFLGIPLELVNQWWRVLAVYFAGVIAGSLGTSVMDPGTYLAGASGGVYAIITAHISNIIMNWSEMTFPGVQLFVFALLISADVATAVHNRYYTNLNQNIGYAAHIGGALAGLLVGIWVLKNVKPTEKERYIWWAAFVLYILLMGTAIALNIFWSDHFLKSGSHKYI